MQVKPGSLWIYDESDETSPFLRFYLELGRLKELYRQGWLKRGIPQEMCETVAEHVFGTALLTLALGPVLLPEMDQHQALQLALIHDLGEVYAGDLTPADDVSSGEKSDLESDALKKITASLPAGEELYALWQEYEAGKTPEAKFVRQVDKLEMGLQAGVYALKGGQGMEEFFGSARLALQDEKLGGLLSEMVNLVRGNRDLVQFPDPGSE